MTVVLQSATRERAAPCKHYRLVVLVDGVPRNLNVHLDDFQVPTTVEDVEGTIKTWVRYHILSKGKTLAQLVGQTIFEEIP